MRPSTPLEQITIKVPGPFEGVAELGFSARYPEQSLLAPLRDVPLWIEGPAEPVRRLANRLRLLAESVQGGAYAWTDPILLTDEVVVIAFRDRSLAGRGLADGATSSLDYVLNLVRPVVFPFLRDCVEIGHLRLAALIGMTVHDQGRQIAELELRLDQIVAANGDDLLVA
jgi:hypothetical protein